MNSGWWFHILLVFTPILGEMIQFDDHMFQMGGSTTVISGDTRTRDVNPGNAGSAFQVRIWSLPQGPGCGVGHESLSW